MFPAYENRGFRMLTEYITRFYQERLITDILLLSLHVLRFLFHFLI